MARTKVRASLALALAALAFAHAPDALAQSPYATSAPDVESDVQSPAMMYTGIALSTTGFVGLGVGTGVFFHMAGQGGDFAALGAMMFGGAILIPSSILVQIGIPLWAVGASEPDRPRRASAIPEVSIGAGGGSLRWSF